MGAAPARPSETVETDLLSKLESNCQVAAEAIAEADVFLLCTGAGFSADSGLAIYADVAKVEAYASRGLTYHDICQPDWLEQEPDLFWGFWGQCFNDYRNTPPHEGYEIINRWVDRKFRTSEVAHGVRKLIADADASRDNSWSGEAYTVEDRAGAFYVFTSNVDAHHFDWFRACEIRECHGNTELYQCANGGNCAGIIWRAPTDYKFTVNKDTMLASNSIVEPEEGLEASDSMLGDVPRIGHVKGGGRETMLRYMPGVAPGRVEAGFSEGHPKCKHCGGPARPAILMFADGGWYDMESQNMRWNRWSEAVCAYIKTMTDASVPVKVVILEVGAGGNVTTVRSTSERQMKKFRDSGAVVRLIRVNPDLPLGDGNDVKPGGPFENEVISIMSRGLASIRMIDAMMPT